MSKTSDAIKLAFRKGYRVVDGEVVSPHGKIRKCHLKKSSNVASYRVFNVGLVGGETYPVLVHRLLAFEKFGEASFAEGIQVRHLDNNSLNNSWDNIVLGTPTQNAMDRPKMDRQAHAALGNQQFTEEFIHQLRLDHISGLGYKKLRAKYGIPLSTLSYYLSSRAKRTSFSIPLSHP